MNLTNKIFLYKGSTAYVLSFFNLKNISEKDDVKMNKVLNRIEVEINNKKATVGIAFKDNKMFGVINKTRFIWDYTNYYIPTVQVENKARRKEAAMLGKMFIEKRLEMADIKLEIKKPEPQAPKYTLLKTEEVIVNNIARNVGIKIENNKMYGVLNKTRFIWDYTNYAYPTVQVKEGADKLKAAKYARLFIIERLNKDNVKLNIKTFEKKVNYIHIEKKNGVWINAFENRYLRGQVDGVNFIWNTSKYNVAQAVTEAGNKGSYINTSIDINKIKERLKSEGFTCFNHLFASITPAAPISKNPFGANASIEENVSTSDDKAVAV